jgi:hypothetical protein
MASETVELIIGIQEPGARSQILDLVPFHLPPPTFHIPYYCYKLPHYEDR